MLIPIPSTFSLQGQLLGAAHPGAAVDPAGSQALHALLIARPSQCAQLGYEEPATASIHAPGREGALFEAHITRVVPNAAPAGVEPACQIELELRAPQDTPELTQALPPGAAVSAMLSAQPRNWLSALVDQAAGEGQAGTLGARLGQAYHYAEARAKHFSQNTELGQNLKASIQDILKPEAEESED